MKALLNGSFGAAALMVVTMYSPVSVAAAFKSGSVFDPGAAAAMDASTLYFNPAGLTYMGVAQSAVSATVASNEIHYKGTASIPNTDLTVTQGPSFDVGAPSTVNVDGSDTAYLLGGLYEAFFALPINERFTLGLGTNTPFGLSDATQFDEDSIVRFAATKRQLLMRNYTASLGFQINDQWSIGAGLELQDLTLALESRTLIPVSAPVSADILSNVPGATGSLAGLLLESQVNNEIDSAELGFVLGIHYAPRPATRLGLSYHSEVRHSDAGGKRQTYFPAESTSLGGVVPLEPTLIASSLKGDFNLPAIATFSWLQFWSERLGTNLTVEWTQWSAFDKLVLHDTSTGESSVTRTNYHDTWRVALGAGYRLSPRITARAGISHDGVASKGRERAPALPDDNKFGLGLSGIFHMSPAVDIDVTYFKPFYEEVSITNTTNSQVVYTGEGERKSQALGVKVVWRGR